MNRKNKEMKKIFVLIIIGLNFCFAYSQKNEDPNIMTVGDIEVPLSEFLFIAQKDDSGINLLDKKSLANYMELFKIFKQKVADAKALRVHESLYFQHELATYQAQLTEGYLSDYEGEKKAIQKMYEQGKDILSLSHIMFGLPEQSLTKDTLEVFHKANEVYRRIKAGEDFAAVGNTLMEDANSGAVYEEQNYIFPMQTFKEIIDVTVSMSPGDISAPIRTPLGFHIIRLNQKIEDVVRLRVAHIVLNASENLDANEEQALLQEATAIYEKIKKGEDFAALAEEYSDDENTKYTGGVLAPFGLGNMVLPFEQAAFALENTGDVSMPVRTRFGYHIIKLLEKNDYPSFDEMSQMIYMTMQQGDRIHELYQVFDDNQKKKMGYIFYEDAYNEMLKLSDDYFPTDTAFYNRASQMTKPIMQLKGMDFPQYEFADYINMKSTSQKTYSGDFLNDQYALFVREILIKLIERDIEDEPEFNHLMNEYYDGILFFEVSDSRVWSKPVEEQEDLEQQWIQELNQKYKVTINKKIVNNMKKYLK